jgi:hypothetical protein
MHQQIYDILKRVAKAGGTIYYSDLCKQVGLPLDGDHDARVAAGYLYEISKYEVEHGNPMLSVVVINKKEEMPGKGFFELARSLGRYSGADDLDCYANELKKVHEKWKNADLSASDPS